MSPETPPPTSGANPARKPERIRAGVAKKVMLEMLRKYPIVEAACAKAGISRSTHYQWVKKDARYGGAVEEAVRDSLDTVNDIAESNIIEGVKKGDHKSSTFWLTHRHPAYRKKGDDLEDAKVEQLMLKPRPSEAFIASVRKYNPDYQPPKKEEYITRKEWERQQRHANESGQILLDAVRDRLKNTNPNRRPTDDQDTGCTS